MIAGGVIASVGVAVLVAAPWRLVRLAALALAVAGGAVLLATLRPDADERLQLGGGVAALVVAAVLAVAFRRYPWLFATAALACAPARIPVDVGGDEANLLLPLYVVIAGGTLTLALELLRGDDRERELGLLTWPLAAFVAWSGVSLAWSEGAHEGAVSLAAFYLPFALLALILARLPWKRRWLTALGVQLVAMALAFGAIGVYQWLTRDVFWNPKVIVSNAYAPFYRVNSVFWDPSIYGRFLVVAILASLVIVLYGARRDALLAAGAIVATWIGLVVSFSQSSFVALIAGVLAAVVLAWEGRVVAGAAAACVLLVAAGFAAPAVRSELFDTSRATGGRTDLVREGAGIAVDNPVAGVGLGGFKSAYGERVGFVSDDANRAASHTTPVTVAAETGAIGLALFAWLVVIAIVLPFRRASRSFAGRASLSFGLALVAILVHSLFYNAFFEDPMSWGLLGLTAFGYTWRTRARATRARSNGK